MKDKKALSIKEVLFVKEYKLQEGARMAPIAENQSRLAEIIVSGANALYNNVKSVQTMLYEVLKDVECCNSRPISKNLKESIINHARSLLSEEGFLCFEEDFNFAIEATRKERSLRKKVTKDGQGYVLFDEEFMSTTKNLLKHIEFLGDNSSSFESAESKLYFRYKGVDIDICLKKSSPEKSDWVHQLEVKARALARACNLFPLQYNGSLWL